MFLSNMSFWSHFTHISPQKLNTMSFSLCETLITFPLVFHVLFKFPQATYHMFPRSIPHPKLLLEEASNMPLCFSLSLWESQSECAFSIATFISKVLELREPLLTFTYIIFWSDRSYSIIKYGNKIFLPLYLLYISIQTWMFLVYCPWEATYISIMFPCFVQLATLNILPLLSSWDVRH